MTGYLNPLLISCLLVICILWMKFEFEKKVFVEIYVFLVKKIPLHILMILFFMGRPRAPLRILFCVWPKTFPPPPTIFLRP